MRYVGAERSEGETQQRDNGTTEIRLTDDRPSERHIATEVHIPGDRQVVELDNCWDLLESRLELLDLRQRQSAEKRHKVSAREQLASLCLGECSVWYRRMCDMAHATHTTAHAQSTGHTTKRNNDTGNGMASPS
jgi:hypothetical protein